MIKPTYQMKRNQATCRATYKMEINSVFLVAMASLLLTLISLVTPTEDQLRNQHLLAATEEMQKANYFTFVMLIKMSPPDARLEGNVTFLMPNDLMLANTALQEGSVSNFLLRHSIPSPLLFGTLEQFPIGTTIPSLLPNYMLRVSNNDRRNFVVNNVKVISPNICISGSSIRCHGIDGVLLEACTSRNNESVHVPLCPNNNTDHSCKASPPTPSPSPSLPSTGDYLIPPTWVALRPTVTNVGPQISGSPPKSYDDGSMRFVACLMLSLVGIYF